MVRFTTATTGASRFHAVENDRTPEQATQMIKPQFVVPSALILLVAAAVGFLVFSATEERDVAKIASPARITIGHVDAAQSPSSTRTVLEDPPELLAPRDWVRSLQESSDYFTLARDLAAAALTGDISANYVLSEALLKCEVYKRILATFGEGSVVERAERYLAEQAGSPADGTQRRRREVFACERIFTEDPFDRLALPDDARDFRFWSQRAVELGDPIAIMNRALRLAASRSPTETEQTASALRQSLLNDVRRATGSGDPRALFMIGTLFSQPAITESVEVGLSWQLAACESGYDCSNGNPDFGFGCIEVGTCLAGFTFQDMIQRDLGSVRYAAVYASAQDILYKTRSGDWDGLQQYLKIK